jgi:hypothetical protein
LGLGRGAGQPDETSDQQREESSGTEDNAHERGKDLYRVGGLPTAGGRQTIQESGEGSPACYLQARSY